MDNDKAQALDEALEAHVRYCDRSPIWKADDWKGMESGHSVLAKYLADNPSELERIRAEIELKDKGETMGKSKWPEEGGLICIEYQDDKVNVRFETSAQLEWTIEDGDVPTVVISDPMEIMDNDKAQLENLGAWKDRVFTPEQRAVALLKESRDIFTYQAPECMYAHAKGVRIAERINRALENLGAVSEGEKPIVRTQENVQVGDVRWFSGRDEEVLHIASEECMFPVLVRWQGDSGRWETSLRTLEQMQQAPLQNPTDEHGNPISAEPEHAFPESDDELVGEMFEDGEGEVFIVAGCGVIGGACVNVNKDCCVWRTLEAIRSYKPLGPSPEKRKRMAMERVCEAAEQWRDGGACTAPKWRDQMFDALDEMAKVEGESDE